jgi:hypothetical protein
VAIAATRSRTDDRSMKSLAIFVAAALVGTASPSGIHDFDFQVGHWRVHHRRLKPGTQQWVEFDGTVANRALIDGSANLEEHDIPAPTGAYRAVGLRAYDAKTREWAIWWLDGRYPSLLGAPVKGRFEGGVGRFFADYEQDGKPMRGRFLWSDITPKAARWEQAASSDGGQTWAPNWIMTLEREPSAMSQPEQPVPNDFAFLYGEWRVHHRYLRVKDGRREWLDTDGTAACRPILGGQGNVEEHTIQAPSGAYRAIGLRAYDPKASRWSIWWLDGRAPHEIDPPVQGGFENGVGTFHGETTIDGKPTRLRFVWSQITATSARWEQAYSSDGGHTWETNWTMEFRRAS